MVANIKVRGIRQTVAGGQVLGRLVGNGPVQLLSVNDLRSALGLVTKFDLANATGSASAAATFIAGVPSAASTDGAIAFNTLTSPYQGYVYSATAGAWKLFGPYNLAGLGDVNISGTPTDGSLLAYSVSAGKWQPTPALVISGAGPPSGFTKPIGTVYEDTTNGDAWVSTYNGPLSASVVQSSPIAGATVSGTITCVLPVAPSVGNILIVMYTAFSGGAVGSGFTLLHTFSEGDDNLFLAYRVVQAGDSASQLVATGAVFNAGVGVMWEAAGIDPVGLADVLAGVQSASVTTNTLSLPATTANNEIAFALSYAFSSTATVTPDAGFTVDQTNASINSRPGWAGHKAVPTSGTVTSETTTFSVAAVNEVIMASFKTTAIVPWKHVGPISAYNGSTLIDTQLKSIKAGANMTATTDGSGNIVLAAASGGVTTLAGLSDVSVSEGAGINGYNLQWNNSAAKWQAVAPPASAPAAQFFTGAPSASVTPSLDGTPITTTFSGGTSGTITFSTTAINRLAVLLIGVEQSGVTIRVNTVTSTHLTWTRRGYASVVGSRGTETVEIWWAPVASAVTSEVVTMTFSATLDDAAVGVFVLQNVADITNPFDPNVALPSFSTQASPGPTAAPVFSTTNPNSFVFAGLFSSSALNDTSAWSGLLTADNGGGGNWGFLSSFYNTYSTAQTGVTASLTSTDNRACLRFADAITGYKGPAPAEGTPGYDTSTTPYTPYIYHASAWHQVT